MSLNQYRQRVHFFVQRIKEVFQLEEDTQDLIFHRRSVIGWLQDEIMKIREAKEKLNTSGGLQGLLNLAGFNASQLKTINATEHTLLKLKELCRRDRIQFDPKQLAQLQIPKQINQSFSYLAGKQFPAYYGIASSPLMKSCFLKSKQCYDKCITQVKVNDIKCVNLGSDSTNVIKYQRYLLEHLFNRLFVNDSELTTVLKIEVENRNSQKTIDFFCCLQDLAYKPKDSKPLQMLQVDKQSNNLFIQEKEDSPKQIVDDKSLFYAFMTQLFIVPIQTVVSDYVVARDPEDKCLRLKKMHYKETETQTIFDNMREHPSLRNPLTYFIQFLKNHQFKIDSLKQILDPRRLYANFFQILNILYQFLQNDFIVKQMQIKTHSICINAHIFEVLWGIFQELVILSNWLDQVIHPIKANVTLAEIKNKMYPILNQIIKETQLSLEEYKNYMLNLPIENYLSVNVSKVNIEKYKDRYTSLNWVQAMTFNSKIDIYNSIFAKTMKNIDLRNCNNIQAIYFLNFISINCVQLYYDDPEYEVHPSWKEKDTWDRIVAYRNQEGANLLYLSISLDLLALCFGYDSLQNTNRVFEEIRNQLDQDRTLDVAKRLYVTLKKKYQKKGDQYLSYLMEKSFKYKKYTIVRFMIEVGVHIKHYEQLFVYEKQDLTHSSRLNRTKQKAKLKELMQARQPEMYRRYQWQALINVKLKNQDTDDEMTALETIGHGKFYVQKKMYKSLESKNIMNNTLSRKDYMFSNKRPIAKVTVEGVVAYVQLTQYPLLKYFYYDFLSELDKSSLLLNFCGFYTDKGNLFHMIESIPQCFNFEKGLQYQTQTQLKNLINETDLSEAIIISMILMPTNVQLKNIIISPQCADKYRILKKGLFIVDLFDFYQKHGFELNSGGISLKTKNSLFLFDQMHNSISPKLMKKYSEMNVIEIINKVFTKCANFIKEINKNRPRCDDGQRQLYSLIFQNGYAFALAQRMFKIRNTFLSKLKTKEPMDHLDLLQIIDPQLSYYYEQIIRSSHKLIEREQNLHDQKFRHSFIVSENLITFFAKGNHISTQADNFPQHYMKFNFQGPSQNLKLLHEEAIKFKVFQQKITQFRDYDHQIIQYFIRHIDLFEYDKAQRELLFDKVQDYSLEYLQKQRNCLPLSIIRISYIEQLRERRLKFSDERLRDMILENLSCTQSQFNYIIKKYQSIHHLHLQGVKQLQRVGQMYINVANSLEIRNLKRLSIINCPELEFIDIKCDQLENLTLRNNSSLTHIYVNSKKLKNMDCYQCNKLRLQNIGIYIFLKVNVLLCKNSCDGDVKRLQDPNYSIYLTRILRYLCNRFEQSNHYKLELAITLNKLELLDQKYYKFGNTRMTSNLGSLLNFVTKAARETLKVTQRQIVQIFLSNQYVDVLSIDQLLKVQIDSLQNIVECLCVTKIYKEFKQVIFKEIIKTHHVVQHLKLIKSMFNCIQTQKNFRVTLTLIDQIEPEYYIQLIELINKKEKLERLEIVFENSFIDGDFFEELFSFKTEKNKIWKLQFLNCQLQIGQNLRIEAQSMMKEITFNSCKLRSITFIQKFTSLTNLQLFSCTVPNQIAPFYVTIGRLNQLKSLTLVNLKQNVFQNDLQMALLFEICKKLSKLQQFDFSGNQLSLEQLKYFSQKLSQVKLKQLILNDFYQSSIDKPIDNFLKHETLRIVHIQFKIKQNSAIFKSFLEQLANNKSIVKIKLKTDREIESALFGVLEKNKTLEQIQSNQPIPNWLKNHINSNSQNNQSGIFESEPFQVLSSTNYKKSDFYRIGLSLDGGGVRGLLLASQLDYICKNVKQPLHKIFDCTGGTSIGGILALAGAGTIDGVHPICSTQDMMNIFELYGNKIFKKSNIKQLTSLFDSKYDVSSFQELISSYFKDAKLSDTLKETNVLVTAVNRLTNEDVVFRSITAIFDRSKDFYMRDIARATSAAPTYFPSAQIKNINATQKFSLLDGGVGLNNPSKLVIDDIIKTTQNQTTKNSYFLLSLGTGRPKCDVIPESAGIVNLAPIIDSFAESSNYFLEKDLSQNYRGHYLRLSPLINIPRKDAQLDNTNPDILKLYKQAGYEAAEEQFSNKVSYGKFKNQSFIEWLAQNTARKYDP